LRGGVTTVTVKAGRGEGDPKNCYKYKKNRNKKELSFGENI
jgi:hypothetical protein